MIIPNCREDEAYNYDFLDDVSKIEISGFDYAIEQIVNLFENNLDVYEGRLEVDTEIDVDKFLDKAKDELSKMIKDWAEMGRNELIVSMIESMNDDEYKANKEKALKENPDKYTNTRLFDK